MMWLIYKLNVMLYVTVLYSMLAPSVQLNLNEKYKQTKAGNAHVKISIKSKFSEPRN